MPERNNSMATEILNMVSQNTYLEWALENINSIEPPPWKPRLVLPDRRRKRFTNIIEFIGLPESGKSEILSHIENNPLSNIRQLIYPELLLPHSSVDVKADLPTASVLGFEYANFIAELSKLVIFDQIIRDHWTLLRHDLETKSIGLPILALMERGPFDALAYNHMAASVMHTKQELPKHYSDLIIEDGFALDPQKEIFPGMGYEHAKLFFEALVRAEMVDAVILFGNSYLAATDRRKIKGKPSESLVVNPTNWPLLERGYGWVIGSIMPLLRKRCGTGLLILDGEQNLQSNIEKTINFCRQVVDSSD